MVLVDSVCMMTVGLRTVGSCRDWRWEMRLVRGVDGYHLVPVWGVGGFVRTHGGSERSGRRSEEEAEEART